MPIGFAHSAAGEYTFSIFAVVAIALLASWVVAVVFSPLIGVWILTKPKAVHAEGARPDPARLPPLSRAGDALALGHLRRTLACADCPCSACATCRSSSSRLRPAGIAGRPAAAGERVDLRHARRLGPRRCAAEGDPDVDHWSTYVGRGAVRFYLPLNVQLPNDSLPRQ